MGFINYKTYITKNNVNKMAIYTIYIITYNKMKYISRLRGLDSCLLLYISVSCSCTNVIAYLVTR